MLGHNKHFKSNQNQSVPPLKKGWEPLVYAVKLNLFVYLVTSQRNEAIQGFQESSPNIPAVTYKIDDHILMSFGSFWIIVTIFSNKACRRHKIIDLSPPTEKDSVKMWMTFWKITTYQVDNGLKNVENFSSKLNVVELSRSWNLPLPTRPRLRRWRWSPTWFCCCKNVQLTFWGKPCYVYIYM